MRLTSFPWARASPSTSASGKVSRHSRTPPALAWSGGTAESRAPGSALLRFCLATKAQALPVAHLQHRPSTGEDLLPASDRSGQRVTGEMSLRRLRQVPVPGILKRMIQRDAFEAMIEPDWPSLLACACRQHRLRQLLPTHHGRQLDFCTLHPLLEACLDQSARGRQHEFIARSG